MNVRKKQRVMFRKTEKNVSLCLLCKQLNYVTGVAKRVVEIFVLSPLKRFVLECD